MVGNLELWVFISTRVNGVTDQTGEQSSIQPSQDSDHPAPEPSASDASTATGDKSTNLAERILQSIEDLVTLDINTIVDDGDTKKAIRSTLNLIDGDITTEMDITFVTGDLKELRDYHAQREAQGNQVIKDNIAALGELIKLFKEARSSIDAVQPPAPAPL